VRFPAEAVVRFVEHERIDHRRRLQDGWDAVSQRLVLEQ
jgi:hypothetical protein